MKDHILLVGIHMGTTFFEGNLIILKTWEYYYKVSDTSAF